jgi:hypothetical protein
MFDLIYFISHLTSQLTTSFYIFVSWVLLIQKLSWIKFRISFYKVEKYYRPSFAEQNVHTRRMHLHTFLLFLHFLVVKQQKWQNQIQN